ncbi:MAG TPA: hypothetical protein VLM79_23025 [Kofleriaceae bacterium]|nr:hypothetical protein [Kofleriaceae bacterium]
MQRDDDRSFVVSVSYQLDVLVELDPPQTIRPHVVRSRVGGVCYVYR